MARHKKEINIKLVAEEAGVSLATVSRVINNRTDVSEAMRRKVSAVVEKFNFAPTKGSPSGGSTSASSSSWTPRS